MSTTASRTLASAAPRTASLPSLIGRLASLAYGSLTYALFLGTFLYMIGFTTGAFVPKDINAGPVVPIGRALLINGAFLALFAIQHTIMARPAFKERWTRVVPKHLERTTFVLITCAILIGMVAQWQPLPGVVWKVGGSGAIALWAIAAIGWGTVLVSTFLIDHFELFGLRQVVMHALGRPHQQPRFRERALYKVVRHPLMLGFLVAFWATPLMTWGHLFFAVMITGYVLFGLQVEERTLIKLHGDGYRDYQRRVPMLLPLRRPIQ